MNRRGQFDAAIRNTRRRRAVILPVVMVVLIVLGVLVAGYSFRVHADLSALQANTNRMQTRMAAEAGIEKIKLIIRLHRFDMDVWYNNPDELHRVIVWSTEEDTASIGTDEEYGDTPGYRFSIVADDLTDDEDFCRFGLTDEASKLNLNLATEPQLLLLVQAAVGDDNEEISAQDIVDAILDWRDVDRDPRGEQTDTEGEYYEQLRIPYKVKNGPFDTVEELLLVKGVTPQILYGEDFDRNGLRTDNEDDGDESFPMDNQDGVLNLGMYPYLTTISYETNVANDNRQRIYLLDNADNLRKELELIFPDEPDVVDYIVTTAPTLFGNAGGGNRGGGNRGGGNRPGGSGQPAANEAGGSGTTGTGTSGTDTRGGAGATRGGRLPRGGTPTETGTNEEKQPDGGVDPKSRARSQVKDPGNEETPDEKGEETPVEEEKGDTGAETGEQGDKPADTGAEGDQAGGGSTTAPPGGAGTARPRTPAALFLPQTGQDGAAAPIPLRVEDHLAIVMDKTTVVAPQQREIRGLVNINTAPAVVLRAIPEFTPEMAGAIIEARSQLDSETKKTTAWLVTEGVMDLETYVRVAAGITARAQQFNVEVLGYADHIGMVTRLQVVLDTVGPLAQTIYYRDISHLGATFPIREDDKEKIRVP